MIITISCCVIQNNEQRKEYKEEWQARHDREKWGDPPIAHSNDTNSVMNPFNTNSFYK